MARTYYAQLLRDFDWQRIVREAEANAEDRTEPGGETRHVGMVFLGTVMALTPTGCYYTPWANSNVTEAGAAKDEAWSKALDKVAAKFGGWAESGEGNPTDIFFCKEVDKEALFDRDLAEVIVGHLPYHSVPAIWTTDLDLRITFRRSQRTFTEYGDPFPHVVFTGGCTFQVGFPTDMFTTPNPVEWVRRLGPGWETKDARRVVKKLLQDARFFYHLVQAQENLFKRYLQVAMAGQGRTSMLTELVRTADREANPHNMSYGDLDFWNHFLDEVEEGFQQAQAGKE